MANDDGIKPIKPLGGKPKPKGGAKPKAPGPAAEGKMPSAPLPAVEGAPGGAEIIIELPDPVRPGDEGYEEGFEAAWAKSLKMPMPRLHGSAPGRAVEFDPPTADDQDDGPEPTDENEPTDGASPIPIDEPPDDSKPLQDPGDNTPRDDSHGADGPNTLFPSLSRLLDEIQEPLGAAPDIDVAPPELHQPQEADEVQPGGPSEGGQAVDVPGAGTDSMAEPDAPHGEETAADVASEPMPQSQPQEVDEPMFGQVGDFTPSVGASGAELGQQDDDVVEPEQADLGGEPTSRPDYSGLPSTTEQQRQRLEQITGGPDEPERPTDGAGDEGDHGGGDPSGDKLDEVLQELKDQTEFLKNIGETLMEIKLMGFAGHTV